MAHTYDPSILRQRQEVGLGYTVTPCLKRTISTLWTGEREGGKLKKKIKKRTISI